VRCNYIDAEGCILVNVTADSIIAKPGSVIYNIVDDTGEGLDVSHGQVLAGVFSSDGSQMLMKSSTHIDGGRAWEQRLEWNPKTFEDVYNMNANADPINLEQSISTAHSSTWRSLQPQNDASPGKSSDRDSAVSAPVAVIDATLVRESYSAGFNSGFAFGVITPLVIVGLGLLLDPRRKWFN
jgi:hypothetical protein